MKTKIFSLTALIFLALSCSPKYETVKGDPMGTKIYTLDNGLKVYMTVNKEEPRLQTMIAVRSGGKNDPSDNTGLAHYLEHIMFKGSEHFGTSDYAAEKPQLDSIEALYNIYRTKTDPAERAVIYHQIDSISYEASKISIPNEYDKLMSVIGAKGTNAFTSNDVTCYVEDIPSNQIDTWARVQADRFRNLVIRGFHTELEAVYEEYNMYLNEDQENAMEAADQVLFRNHPYGTQTVIGTQEHLKNPSISAIKKQKGTYYVPNNIAICASGDFNPDEFVKVVEKYFGDWQPNADLPEFAYEPEEPISAPVTLEVLGTEAEFAYVAWRCPGEKDDDSLIADLASSILSNGQSGLIDLDINQQQKALGAGCFNYGRTDYDEMILMGYPQQGQTLTQVRDLLLSEVARLRSGDFDSTLVAAVYNNLKLQEMRSLTNNRSRAMKYVYSFVNGTKWSDEVARMDRLSKVTKQDVVDWANRYLSEESCVTVYKKIGENPKAAQKITAPAITPIVTNRDMQSDFLTEIQAIEVKPIEPVFVDYSKDMSKLEACGMPVLYKRNEQNDIANLSIVFDKGLLADPALDLAFSYVDYLSTSERSASQISSELYALACDFSYRVSDSQTTLTISGLSENVGAALDIIEDRLLGAIADEGILASLKADIMKSRMDSKFNQRACNSALRNYVMYGPEYVKATTLSSAVLASISSEELLSKVSDLMGKQHKFLYYGPDSEAELADMLSAHHRVAENPEPLVKIRASKQMVDKPSVVLAQYDSRQFNYVQYSNRGECHDLADEAAIDLFNNYFGGGMNTIVFQEMREARALAYSAGAYLIKPYSKDDTYCFIATIGSQNDKLHQAVEAFDLIINEMPESQKAFDVAKSGMIAELRTRRLNGPAVLRSYLADEELGLSEPRDREVFSKVQDLTLDDLAATSAKWVKGRTYTYALLCDIKDVDMAYLKTLGPVRIVSLDEIFGY